MSFGSRLTHTVDIIRETDSGTLDDYGQPVTTEAVLATVKAAIQPRSQREIALISQGGAAVSDHVIYLFPTELTSADAILHDSADCPVLKDLPTSRFEVIGVPNAAGLGHHLEVAARVVASPQEAEGS
jgi:head-tail adaptor